MEYVSIKEIAERWNVSYQTVYKYCLNGAIPKAKKTDDGWRLPKTLRKPDFLRKKHNQEFKFVDLFCGIGGFHQAMTSLGGECVFACDINENCRRVYKQNFCQKDEFLVYGDINKAIKDEVIPEFDVLCGGFPCQTFSKAGLQGGFEIVEKENGNKDERGQLFYRIIDILKTHKECKYIILENVRNLADKQDNWKVICEELKALDFIITEEPIIESPHNFGIPQIRERVYILGVRKDALDKRRKLSNGYLTRKELGIDNKKKVINQDYNCLPLILEKNVDKKYLVSEEVEEILNIWDEFKHNVGEFSSPFWIQKAGLGIHNRNEYESNKTIGYKNMPKWKQTLVNHSRETYEANYKFIDSWVAKYKMLERLLIYQKFEWNAGTDYSSMHQCIIQVRQSGIRVKRPNFFPSLVAMNNTPIVWDEHFNHYRYITPYEAAKLQSFNSEFKLADTDPTAYKQLGNSVNVELLRMFSEELFKLGKM